MNRLIEVIEIMRREIETHTEGWTQKCLLLALEQIRDAAMRIDCPENEW